MLTDLRRTFPMTMILTRPCRPEMSMIAFRFLAARFVSRVINFAYCFFPPFLPLPVSYNCYFPMLD